VKRFTIEIEDDFSLSAAGEFLRGFKPAAGGAVAAAARLSLGFLLDGSFEPVAVALEQEDRCITGETVGPVAAVRRQVVRMLSLDVDGRGWAALVRRDPVVAALQERYRGFRAVCFPSPYEAAVWGILAQRVSMAQASRMKEKLAREHGAVLALGGEDVIVPPPPQALLDIEAVAGLPDEKLRRLRGIAEAALAGRLDAERLRALPEESALAELGSLHGVGAWTAAHILYRGAGLADALPVGEPRVLRAVKEAYRLPRVPGAARFVEIAEAWRPYRMWVAIMLVRSIAGTAAWSARGDSARRGRGRS
jgi:DNA-3-methyladenine glycosylase II